MLSLKAFCIMIFSILNIFDHIFAPSSPPYLLSVLIRWSCRVGRKPIRYYRGFGPKNPICLYTNRLANHGIIRSWGFFTIQDRVASKLHSGTYNHCFTAQNSSAAWSSSIYTSGIYHQNEGLEKVRSIAFQRWQFEVSMLNFSIVPF